MSERNRPSAKTKPVGPSRATEVGVVTVKAKLWIEAHITFPQTINPSCKKYSIEQITGHRRWSVPVGPHQNWIEMIDRARTKDGVIALRPPFSINTVPPTRLAIGNLSRTNNANQIKLSQSLIKLEGQRPIVQIHIIVHKSHDRTGLQLLKGAVVELGQSNRVKARIV